MLYCFHGSLRNLSDIQNNLRGSLVILLCADDNHFSCLICWNRLLPRVCKHQCSSLWLGLYEHFYITETNQWEPGSRIHTVPPAFLTVSSDPFLQLLLRAGFAHGPLCSSALQCTVHGYLTLSGISTAMCLSLPSVTTLSLGSWVSPSCFSINFISFLIRTAETEQPYPWKGLCLD